MATVTCTICGGALAATTDGTIHCQTCGLTYTEEAIRNILSAQAASLWDYERTEQGVTILTYTGDAPEVTVPAELDGMPVTGVGKGAFYDKKKLVRVTLPDSIRFLDRLAFCRCLRLEEITVPAKLRRIGSDAFTQCRSLRAFPIPVSVTEIESAAFSVCDNLKEMTVPPGVRELSLLTFYACTRLRRLILSPGLEVIQDSALSQCVSLTELDLPTSLRKIGTMAFWGCTQLKTLRIPPSVQEIGQMPFGAPNAPHPLLLVTADSYAVRWAAQNGCRYQLL